MKSSNKSVLRYLFLASNLLFTCVTFAQNCHDADFESGTHGGYTTFHGEIGNNGVVVFPNQNMDNSQHHIMKITDGFDPIAEQFCIENKNLPVNGSGTGQYSLRLGDAESGGRTSKVVLSFDVTASVSFFLLKYAIVLEDPDHPPHVQPRFELNIKDQDGNLLDCGEYEVRAADSIPGFENCEDWRVRPWTAAGFELESYLGQTISIEILSTDCGRGGHGGYAYIDANCSPLELELESYCPGAGFARYVVTEGFDSYLWNTGENTHFLDIDNPVPGQEYQVTVTSATGCTLVLKDTLPQLPEISNLEPSFFHGPDSLQVCFGEEVIYQPKGTNIGEVYAIELGYSSDVFHLFADESRIINFVTTDNFGCAYDTAHLVLTVNDVNVEYDITSTCEGVADGEIIIDNLGNNTLLTALGNTNFTANYYYGNLTSGEYVLNITNSSGCEFGKNIIILKKEAPEADQVTVNPATCNEQNGSIDFFSQHSSYIYSFNGGDYGTQSSWSDLKGGTYTIEYKDDGNGNGCFTKDTIVIDNFSSPVLSVTASDSTYCGQNNGEIELSATGGFPPYKYSINTIDFYDSNTFYNQAPNDYLVIVRDNGNCTDSTSTSIPAAPFSNIDIAVTPAFCNEDNGSLQVILTNNAVPSIVYLNNEVLEEYYLQNLPEGIRKISIIDHNDCKDSIQVVIDRVEPPVINDVVFSPTPCGVTLSRFSVIATSSLDNMRYSIKGGQFQSSNTFNLKADEYIINVEDELGCAVETRIKIPEEKQFLLANIFSPNEDGINDEFCFQSTDGVEQLLTFLIYDRWGNTIFGLNNPTNVPQSACWDGTYKGSPVQSGVYVYTFQARLTDGRLLCKHGDITLVR